MLKDRGDGKQYGEYQIGGKKYYQDPLTAGQKLEVLSAFQSLAGSQVDTATGKPKPDALALMGNLTGDFLPHFLGVVLLSENEKAVDLASVRSFTERGKALLFQMDEETQLEAVDDFFALNPAWVEKLLSRLGLSGKNLPPGMLNELKEMLGDLSKPSATAGGSTRKRSSGGTPSKS